MRIFWLGMHKILVRTELPRLRQLGHEVFNPPYLSLVPDQSAEMIWDNKQPSTLPPEVFQKLCRYNFFYNKINSEIAEILNKYFDVVIVTIHQDWLKEILKVFHGKVIYRTYGQKSTVSELLQQNRCFDLISKRNNFYFSPHAEEALENEHTWLKENAVVIPYALTNDIFRHQNLYDIYTPKNSSIAVSCPNIANDFYKPYYDFIKKHLPADKYLIYGAQTTPIHDPQVVGTIPRQELITNFLNSNAYLYIYDFPNVCYLPPIEMMILGGPVIFLKGSLLDKYFHNQPAPGRAQDIEEAKALCERLLKGDIPLAKSIVESQNKIKERYYPEYVNPLFDQKMTQLLKDERKIETQTYKPTVFLFHHFPGECVQFKNGHYSAFDGIPRVMRLVVNALLESGQYSVQVTARKDQAVNFYGFFKNKNSQDLKIFCLEDVLTEKMKIFSLLHKFYRFSQRLIPLAKEPTAPPNPAGVIKNPSPLDPKKKLQPQFSRLDKTLKFLVLHKHIWLLSILVLGVTVFRPLIKLRRKDFLGHYLLFFGKAIKAFEQRLAPYFAVQYIQEMHPDSISLIPHYHLFPESIELKTKTVLYLPDFTPHFFQTTGEFGAHIFESSIGQNLAKNASAVFTNSLFSKSYLPDTILQVPENKIHMFYLPNLNKEDFQILPDEINAIQAKIGKAKYLFYPTQPRQNKNIDLLLRVFDQICEQKKDLKLVLTSPLVPNSIFDLEFQKMKHKNSVIFFQHVSDAALSWLYQNATVMTLTSVMEGNFPPQVFEALFHRIPVVATKLPLITERIETLQDHLLLCNAGSESEFKSAILKCLEDTKTVIDRQEKVRELILHQGSEKTFNNEVLKLFNQL